jgi:uncharacterized protein YceK
MARAVTVAILVVAAMSGCGTVANNVVCIGPPPSFREGFQAPYGGVRNDIEGFCGSVKSAVHPDDDDDRVSSAGMAVLCVVDLPFSLVGDTIFLPVNIIGTVRERDGADQRPVASTPDGSSGTSAGPDGAKQPTP